MLIDIQKGRLEEAKADVVIVNEFEGVKTFGGATGAVNKALGGELARVAEEEGFAGKKGQMVVYRVPGSGKARRVLLVGLGKRKEFSADAVRDVSAMTYHAAKKLRARRVASVLHGAGNGKLSAALVARAQTEGVLLAGYEFDRLKKAPEEKPVEIESWMMTTDDAAHVRQGQPGVREGERVARAVMHARDLVNEPAQEMTPRALGKEAERIAKQSGGLIKVTVFEKSEIKKMGMGGLIGVSQGSLHEPVFVHMIYKPRGRKAKKRVAVVGKGITFDSGGLSLKPSQYMTTMKCDMAGSAAVLGLFSVLADMKPLVEVHGIFGACENMPSGSAIRPGDVLRAMNGKTMEVVDTDAEGRLTLADSLSYACERVKPDYLIDLATLTGACMVALGEEIIGLMGNDPKLDGRVMSASVSAGEKMWALPLEKSYRKQIESKVADVKNLGGKYAGALTAGLFLQEFVDEGTPWVHLDIAGPAFAEQELNPYSRYGATGSGVPTLIEFLKSL